MIKVPILDNEGLSNEIIKLLNNWEYYTQKTEEALEFSWEFSWEKTGEEVYNLISQL